MYNNRLTDLVQVTYFETSTDRFCGKIGDRYSVDWNCDVEEDYARH